MSNAEIEVVDCMELHGGSFVKALSLAFRHADSINFAKLKYAFPEYWIEYADMTTLRLKREIEALQEEQQ